MEVVLGISAFYHDSSAALLIDGKIVSAAQEERFSRKKNDASFPELAINFVLQEAGIKGDDVNYVAFYEKPFLKFERLLETYTAFAPNGLANFLTGIPIWIKEKLYTKTNLQKSLKTLYAINAPILFPEHHLSHASSAFYPSPYQNAAILTVDGVGEWATTTICQGHGNQIEILKEMHFPHSLGLLYSAFTYYCGFKVNSDEYKLMGLAPYGNMHTEVTMHYLNLIKTYLVDIREDGSFLLNMEYFNFATGLKMTNNKKWEKLFGVPPRKPKSEIRTEYLDMAYAIQSVTEEIIYLLVKTTKVLVDCDNLVLAGGVALNCVANGKIKQEGIFKNIWIQPAAGDAGGALGAALATWHIYLQKKRTPQLPDSMSGSLLGPSFTNKDIENFIYKKSAVADECQDEVLFNKVASILSHGNIVGWFQGRMEFGPRALGNRSILADPRNPDIQKLLNLNIKNRESFRPFAPSVMEEDANEYFNLDSVSPYMLLVTTIKDKYRLALPADYNKMHYMDRLYYKHSLLPAVTHVDFSARFQTVSEVSNKKYFTLLENFKRITGYGILVNTSFNVRDEPVVCTPEEAYNCFMNTKMDYLVINNFLFDKHNQTIKEKIIP